MVVKQFYVNFHSKTLCCRSIRSVFRDVKCCFNASWGLKGLMTCVCWELGVAWRSHDVKVKVPVSSLISRLNTYQPPSRFTPPPPPWSLDLFIRVWVSECVSVWVSDCVSERVSECVSVWVCEWAFRFKKTLHRKIDKACIQGTFVYLWWHIVWIYCP